MVDIPCASDSTCNCVCNCEALLTNGRVITVGDLVVDGNDYAFNYTITNQDPALSFVVFCVQCPVSVVEVSRSNTTIVITGNPNDTPVVFTECFTPGCESSITNSYFVDFDLTNEPCCRYQGFKIELNPGDAITEIEFEITFTLPDDIEFGFCPGNIKIKTGQVIEIVNSLCMPGCTDACNIQTILCELWEKERSILESNKKSFINLAQLLLPPGLDLNTITVQELESKIRAVAKLENCSANLLCNIAKVLEQLNELQVTQCYKQSTICT